jgi:hypothetical protein
MIVFARMSLGAVAHTRRSFSGGRRWRVGSERPSTAGRNGQTEGARTGDSWSTREAHGGSSRFLLLGAGETVRASCEHRRDRHAAVAYAGAYFQPHLTLLLNCRFVCRCSPIHHRPCTQSVAPNFSIRTMHPSIWSSKWGKGVRANPYNWPNTWGLLLIYGK